ncbi:MAG: GGDEF domain-containing protein [Thermodesulfobacteriota bacterium]|nr:GGDEF domain-containing protein [Thermodesulfobacteriota bacterium]
MISLIPKDDHRQALRMRRSLIAFSGYTVIAVAAVFSYYAGFVRGLHLLGVVAVLGLLFLLNVGVFVLIRTGANLRFKDPSLTIFQLLIGIIFATILCYHMANPIRGAGTVIYILVFVFGTFRLRMTDFLVLSAITTILYILAMALLYYKHPGSVDLKLEGVRTVILAVALMWVSYMANYIANLRRKIKRLASHDALTDVYNRREIFEILEREKSFSDRSGIPFSLCILDLDDFKAINDTHGHQAGDAVLKAFAREVKNNIRSEDYLGRYGGEEFLVVFVNFECQGSDAGCVQRLLNATQGLNFSEIADNLEVTVSIGVAAYIPSETIDTLIARADEALYRAKAGGKNRIEFHSGNTAS